MAMPTIEQLIVAPTAEQIREKVFDVLEGVQIPARSWRKGGVARSVVNALCVVGAQGAAIVAKNVAASFLEFAEGVYLTAHAKDRYDVDRIVATFASGQVTLTNTGGAVYTVGANELIVFAAATGARFRVTQAFVLPAFGTVTVDVQAVVAGSASSVAPAEINTLETPLARVTVSNAARLIGRDAETDAELKVRCKAKRGTWSPFGPRDAYEYAALSATLTDGSPTSITRVATSKGSSNGRMRVACATPSGTPTADELDAVRLSIRRLAAVDTDTYDVIGATPKNTTSSLIVWARGGTREIILARCQAAHAALISTYRIGGIAKTEGGQGYLFADRVAAAVIGSSAEVFDVDGAVDISLDPEEVAVDVTTFDVRVLT